MKSILIVMLFLCSVETIMAQNVGVGTSTPIQKLDVSGNINIKLDSSYRINNLPVISTKGTGNSFVGANAGMANTTGSYNTFLGTVAGYSNTGGLRNVFVGVAAGYKNLTGNLNSFLGTDAGHENTVGESNVFVGFETGYKNISGSANVFAGNAAGWNNTIGNENVFIGLTSGHSNTEGSSNTFIGKDAGFSNTLAHNNTFVGRASGGGTIGGGSNSFYGVASGELNTTGGTNTFSGYRAGHANTVGSDNTVLGANADLGNNNLQNATAIGAGAVVNASNSMVLGNNANVGIGVSAPAAKLDILGASATGFPHIKITEPENDFSRIGFYTAGSTKYWETAVIANENNAQSYFNIFNNSAGNLFTIRGDGRVGINKDQPSAQLDVNGYSKFGESAPAIKMKKLTGTMPATQGSTITVAHGIADYSKILSVEILVSYTLSNSVPHSYTYAAGYEFNYYVISSGIVITTAPANSATIIGKPVRILVTYEE